MQPPIFSSPRRPKNLLPSPAGKHLAFSLIELLTVMGILALLATVSVPSLSGIMKGRALSDASDKAWGAISAARQEAISRQANVAVVLTNGRSASPYKSDAFILLVASSSQNGGTVTWTWSPISRWLKLPIGIAVAPEAASYLSSAQSTTPVAAYSGISGSIPRLEGETISDYSYVVFRPDGTVDSASANPVLGFRRLRPDASAAESALVLSPESGRARVVQL
jgi:prepilin-type N-terminal cleavage/methylation domain-containing protein